MKKYIGGVLYVLFLCLMPIVSVKNENVGAMVFQPELPQSIINASIQAPDNIWYTGKGDYAHYFLIKYWNGNQIQTPQGLPAALYQPYDSGEAILALSQKNVWVVGSGPSDLHPLRIYHLDGTHWKTVPEPVLHGEAVHSLVAVNAQDLWAVGNYNPLGNNDGAPMKTFIMRWDGISWQHIESPSVAGRNNFLWSVTALSVNDVWAVGNTEGFNGGDQALIEHWNGKSWRIVPNPLMGVPVSSGYVLKSVTAVSKNDVWAAGNDNHSCDPAHRTCSSSTLIEHWNGKAWQIVSSFSTGSLSSIDAHNINDIWVVGMSNEKQCDSNWTCSSLTLIEHWNGKVWQIVPGPTPSFPGSVYNGALVAIHAFSEKNVWALGYSNAQAQVFLEHWNGKMWQIVKQGRLS